MGSCNNELKEIFVVWDAIHLSLHGSIVLVVEKDTHSEQTTHDVLTIISLEISVFFFSHDLKVGFSFSPGLEVEEFVGWEVFIVIPLVMEIFGQPTEVKYEKDIRSDSVYNSLSQFFLSLSHRLFAHCDSNG